MVICLFGVLEHALPALPDSDVARMRAGGGGTLVATRACAHPCARLPESHACCICVLASSVTPLVPLVMPYVQPTCDRDVLVVHPPERCKLQDVGSTSASLFEDEEAAAFYQSLPDLRAVVPAVLLGGAEPAPADAQPDAAAANGGGDPGAGAAESLGQDADGSAAAADQQGDAAQPGGALCSAGWLCGTSVRVCVVCVCARACVFLWVGLCMRTVEPCEQYACGCLCCMFLWHGLVVFERTLATGSAMQSEQLIMLQGTASIRFPLPFTHSGLGVAAQEQAASG